MPALLSLVAAGAGVGAVPRLALAGQVGDAVVGVPLVGPVIARQVGVVRRRDRPLGRAADAFMEVLLAARGDIGVDAA